MVLSHSQNDLKLNMSFGEELQKKIARQKGLEIFVTTLSRDRDTGTICFGLIMVKEMIENE